DDPKLDGWLATIFDPCFKTLLTISSAMQQKTMQELYRRIELS
ncbi:19188_t:CDS:1, partial [Cetraspora pellucida]